MYPAIQLKQIEELVHDRQVMGHGSHIEAELFENIDVGHEQLVDMLAFAEKLL